MTKFILPILAVTLMGVGAVHASQVINVPDAGSTATLLGSAVVGIGFLRRFISR